MLNVTDHLQWATKTPFHLQADLLVVEDTEVFPRRALFMSQLSTFSFLNLSCTDHLLTRGKLVCNCGYYTLPSVVELQWDAVCSGSTQACLVVNRLFGQHFGSVRVGHIMAVWGDEFLWGVPNRRRKRLCVCVCVFTDTSSGSNGFWRQIMGI